ncbi:MAG: hypothetical protein AUJ72_03385 [Candidatus Omnitrophica bacterium CG1_02_46_14]|nr:MAG: hypothetical protein AUJ72_03385 [Candidatus Omnitrophica bacterium CG1_02_46_14]
MVEKSLPVFGYKEDILQAVKNNAVTVITAETGAGKSTQVPQFLLEEGYQVVVTQSRRLAARTVAERVAEEVGCELGGVIGYRTGFERCDSAETQVLFCTDGLQLVREITGSGRAQVLVIDEVHEWNINIETLVAWTRKRIAEGWPVKVVLMSATLEADRLAKYYGENVPVIEVPGRLFPVEEKQDYSDNLVANIKKLVGEGRNILVFQPGKKEIAGTCDELAGCGAIVLPLHGELEPAEQRLCFKRYNQPKVVVATNVAQTSVTIPDIDAVVDSGIERRVELADGIEGLYLKPISQADCAQRKGRAGRTKEGVYILCGDSMSGRPAFPKAEIERSRLDQTVLRLVAVGIDATELQFFHQPDREVLVDAKKTLFALGAMTADGQVTKIGRMMARLPLSVQFARMIVEAERLGVVDDVITIAAVLEISTLRDRTENWRDLTSETESDLLAELDIWNAGKGKKGEELREMGIFGKSYWRAKELRGKLRDALLGHVKVFTSTGNRQDILKACVTGMVDHLFHSQGYGEYRNGGNGTRQKGRESVVSGSPEWVVGLPKDIQFKDRRGRFCTLNLVSMLTKVDPAWLVDVAPQLVQIEEGLSPYFDGEQDACFSTTKTHFNGQMVKEKKLSTPEHEQAAEVFVGWLAQKMTI